MTKPTLRPLSDLKYQSYNVYEGRKVFNSDNSDVLFCSKECATHVCTERL